MAKKVEIEIDVNSNIEPSLAQLKALKKQLKETAAGSAEFKRLSADIRDVEDAIEGAKLGAEDFAGSLEAAPGPIGQIFSGLKKVELATKSFGAAWKAVGIGLIVSAVAGLAAAFSQSEDAGKKLQPLLIGFQKIFNGIFRALEPVFNTLIDLATKAMPYVTQAFGVAYSAMSSFLQGLGKLGSAIGKLIKGDFTGAWEDAKSSVTDFGKRYDEANKSFIAGTEELTSTEKEELEKRQKAREDAEAKRKAAAEKAFAEKEAREKEAFAEEQRALQKQLDEMAAIRERMRKLNPQVVGSDGLTKEQREQAQADKEARDKYFREKDAKLLEESNKTGLGKFLMDKAILLQKDFQNEEAIAMAKKRLADLEVQNKQETAYAIADITAGLANLISQDTAAGKAAAVASATIDTYLSASNIFKQASKNPITIVNPAYPYLMAAPAVLAGIARVKQILSVKVPAGGGAAAGGASTPAPSTPPPSFAGGGGMPVPQINTAGGANPTSQLGETIARAQKPVEAYVISQKVSSQQALDRRTNAAATFG